MRFTTPEEWEAIKALAAALPQPSLEEMQQLDMFEWLSPPMPEVQEGKTALVAWLNQHIDSGQVELDAHALKP